MMTPQKMKFLCLTVHHKDVTMHLIHEDYLPSTPLMLIYTWKKITKRKFQTILLNDEHWTTEEIPDRPLCIHKHLLPHGLCPYPCPYADYETPSYYETMDLSDISKFKDLMTTSSDEDIPALKDSIY